METALISVIIPVYNTAPYLKECLASVTEQSYRDLEILLIDDCSTDGSSAILDKWEEQDARIRVIHKEKNSGVSDSRNMGLTLARGGYISLVDSDDWLDRDMLEKMQGLLAASGADVAVCGHTNHFTDGTSKVIPSGVETGTVLERNEAFSRCLTPVGCNNNCYTVTKLFTRSSVMTENGTPRLFSCELHFCEDVLWFAQVLMNSRKAVFAAEGMYHVRRGRAGNSGTVLRAGTYDPVRVYDLVYRILRDAGIPAAANAYQHRLFRESRTMKLAADNGRADLFRKCARGHFRRLWIWFRMKPSGEALYWVCRRMLICCVYTARFLLRKRK